MTLMRYYPTRTYDVDEETVWTPEVDIMERKDDFLILLDMPGMTREDFKIEVSKGVLTINGERKRGEDPEKDYYHYLERSAGKFERSFRVPDNVNGDAVTASYADGVLKVMLPKKEEAKPHTIEIA